jgi:predicted nucleotidyltransferase
MIKFGLKESSIEQIKQIFLRYPTIDKAILYGSRAKGNYKQGSDIDLTLIGENINHDQLWQIAIEIDDLLLPYLVDLSIFDDIDNSHLIDHINRIGVTFYERSTQKVSNE